MIGPHIDLSYSYIQADSEVGREVDRQKGRVHTEHFRVNTPKLQVRLTKWRVKKRKKDDLEKHDRK
jgi:hypothetical protein